MTPMKHPAFHATVTPGKVAYEMLNSGESLTFAELDAASNQAAHALRTLGVGVGENIAFLLENRLDLLVLAWAAQRSGVIYAPISRYLTASEAAFIVEDCGAKVFITTAKLAEVATEIQLSLNKNTALLMLDNTVEGYALWSECIESMPTHAVADECAGASMLYSSGTTGRPKGILRAYPKTGIDSLSPVVLPVCEKMAGMSAESVYLSPAPLYHSAPLATAMIAAGLGCTTVVMPSFDEMEFLGAIEKHRISHTQVVPTMFVRLLKMPQAQRERFDTSSLQSAIHVAAPCPVKIKQQMIDWWGPILIEFYAGTEGNGVTASNTQQWKEHPGTVGKALIGEIYILDDDGKPLPIGEIGDVYFNAGQRFEYHGDPEKTAKAFTADGWSTLGDIGYLDDDGFLYLTDRRAYTIISGGVNVYPQETEDLLISHPAVADVAVFGVSDEEMGEIVQAVVQPLDWQQAGPELEKTLRAYCRENLSAIKTPKSIDFREVLPRTPTGKLLKRILKDEYQTAATK